MQFINLEKFIDGYRILWFSSFLKDSVTEIVSLKRQEKCWINQRMSRGFTENCIYIIVSENVQNDQRSEKI